MIEKARYWDQIDIPVLDDNLFVMVGLLDESRFFVFDADSAYEDAVEHMARTLAEQGQADGDFPRRLREREQKVSMVFDHGVAIPHAPQYAHSRLVLAIGVFPDAVRYREQEIRVIFLMGIPAEPEAGASRPEIGGSPSGGGAEIDDSLLIRVYEEIISVTQDSALLESVAEAKDFSSLLRVLYRQG